MRHTPTSLFLYTLLTGVLGVLMACTSDEQSATSLAPNSTAFGLQGLTSTGSGPSASAGMGSVTPAGLGCSWLVSSDADKVNIAFPDSQAKYWVAAAPITPGTRLRIDGKYPDARYFSFNSYDVAQRPVDAIADFEISPRGGVNPFVTEGINPGGAYTAYLEYGESPTQNSEVQRKANTFYSGQAALGPAGLPNGGLVLFIYRIYVSKTGKFFDGGVGLPQLTLETADGSRELGSLPNCAESPLPNLGGNLPELGINNALLGVDLPSQLKLPFPTASYPSRSAKFFGLSESVLNIVSSQSGRDVPFDFSIGAGGFLSNVHNAYTTSTFSRRYGDIALVRAKAPSHRGSGNTGFGQEQVRYWSVCGNEFATQRYTACAADFQTALDDQGYFTVVLSDTADRPALAQPENGFTWLPWGPYPDQLLIYRHMLPNPTFAQAIQNVQKGEGLEQQMGEFAPQATYCRASVFKQSSRPADVFALCVADQKKNPPSLTE